MVKKNPYFQDNKRLKRVAFLRNLFLRKSKALWQAYKKWLKHFDKRRFIRDEVEIEIDYKKNKLHNKEHK